jgi:cell wall-associated NlpC family hydrolase
VTNGEKFVEAARSYVGTPFFHTGRSRRGLDCVGLLLCSCHDVGVLTGYDHTSYSAVMPAGTLRHVLSKFCDVVTGEPQAGDVLLYKFGGLEQHTAVFTGEGTIVHAFQDAGVVAEHSMTGAWKKHTSAWRLKDELWPV